MNSRQIAGRIGGFTTRARHDPKEYTRAGRASFLERFIPDDPSLSEQEKTRRAEAALKAHMTRLAISSAKKRRKEKNHDH